MYNGFNKAITNIMGTGKKPVKDRTGPFMSQENWEAARRYLSEKKFSTAPTSKRRVVVSPYTRVKGRDEAISQEGTKAMALRIHPQKGELSDQEKLEIPKRLNELADVRLREEGSSWIFKDVKTPAVGSKKKIKLNDLFDRI